jgi:hypothetical protein
VSTAQHPSPARNETSLLALVFGLLAGPAGWVGQHLIIYGLAGYACDPHGLLRTAPLPGWSPTLRPLLVVVFLLGLGLAAAGGLIAWRCWRETGHETAGGHPDALEAGTGRSRFFAIGGLLISLLFAVVIVFEGVMLLGSPLCRD